MQSGDFHPVGVTSPCASQVICIDRMVLASLAAHVRLFGDLLDEMCQHNVTCMPETSTSSETMPAPSQVVTRASDGFFSALRKVAFRGTPATIGQEEAVVMRSNGRVVQRESIARSLGKTLEDGLRMPCHLHISGPLVSHPSDSLPVPVSTSHECDAPSNEGFNSTCETLAMITLQDKPCTVQLSTTCSDTSYTDISLIDLIGGWSTAAKLIIMFGGLATTNRQIVYDGAFALSFCICFLSCAVIPFFVRQHPFHTDSIGYLTVYMHVVGFHTWIFWKKQIRNGSLEVYVSWLTGDTTGDTTNKWLDTVIGKIKWRTQLLAWVFLVVQLVLTVVCLVGVSGLSFASWLSGEDALTERAVSLGHALVMLFVVPQHVPALATGLLAFILVNYLHQIDAAMVSGRVDECLFKLQKKPPRTAASRLSTVVSKKQAFGLSAKEPCERDAKDTARLVVELVCQEAERAQMRLEFICVQWRLLWLHMLVFAFWEVMVVGHHVLPILAIDTREKSLQFWQTDSSVAICLLAFHGLLGCCMLIAVLITPAGSTSIIKKTCMELLNYMRVSGASIGDCESGASFLEKRLRGFMFYWVPVTPALVSLFYSLLILCGMILAMTGFANHV
eukprot:TRINITY_DN6324_c0_g3_i1.p1 TRINITY_DN6324_c0_g3~~TRINITY_DN6324_c0_g3_i1.p1  ORF type:complete len:617 (-),score=73.92 TRINITY_DN6324_c0_g3_i1:81-1931(-)